MYFNILPKQYQNSITKFTIFVPNVNSMYITLVFIIKKIYVIICKLVNFVKLMIKLTPHIIINTENIFFRLTSSLNMK